MFRMVGFRSAIVAALLMALGLVACGGSEEKPTGGTVAEDPVTVTEAPEEAPDVAAVCDGKANDAAPDYDNGAGNVTVYQKEKDSSEYLPRDFVGELPEGSIAPTPEEATVVVCLDITESEVVDTCNYDDPETGDEFRVQIANATYNVTAYEAQTGEEIETTKEIEGEVGSCPPSEVFEEGQLSEIDYARPIDDLKAFLDPIAFAGS